jgi:heme exporter protein A
LPVRALSQGQKRRSALARLALSARVPLWILDEPFSALDVDAVRHLEQLILAYIGGGGSVIFTTHQDAAITAHVTQRIDLHEVGEALC